MVKELKCVPDFAEAIGNESTGLVIIDFFTDWCGPCKKIAPLYEKMAENFKDVCFYKINAECGDVAKIVEVCKVQALPTFCLFCGGKYITNMVGANDKLLESMIVQNMPKKQSTSDLMANSGSAEKQMDISN